MSLHQLTVGGSSQADLHLKPENIGVTTSCEVYMSSAMSTFMQTTRKTSAVYLHCVQCDMVGVTLCQKDLCHLISSPELLARNI